MSTRQQTDRNTLVELLSIIKGIDISVLRGFRKTLASDDLGDEDDEYWADDLGKVDKPVFQKDGAIYALGKLDSLIAKSSGVSPYVQKALRQYHQIVKTITDLSEKTIYENPHIFSNLGFVAYNCVIHGQDYMESGGPNECLDNIIPAKNPVASANIQLQVEQALNHDAVVPTLKSAVTTLETYLQMCEGCPFQAFYTKEDNKPENGSEV